MYARSSAATHPRLPTRAACVQFTPHPSDKTAVLYPNLLERRNGFSGDIENLPVTRHAEEEGWKKKSRWGPLNNKTRDLFKRWLRSGPWLTCRTERGSPFLVSGSSPELLEPPDTCFGDVENFPPVMRHVSEGVGAVEQCQTKRWNWVTVRNLVATQIRYMRDHGITAGSWAARILVTDTLPRRVETLVLRILIPPHRIYHFPVRKVLEKKEHARGAMRRFRRTTN